MKKIALFSAVLLSVCSFSSCSEKISDAVSEAKKDAVENSIEKMDDATKDFEMGVVADGVYTSDFSKMTFTAPENWVFSSQEEILQMMDMGNNISGEVAEVNGGDAELTKKLLEKTTIYDMVASNPETGENVIIMFENIKAYGLDPDEYTVDDYIENTTKLLGDVDSIEYTQLGDTETAMLGDKEFSKTVFEATMAEINYTTSQIYYVYKIDDFMMSIVSSSGITGNDMTTYESCFDTIK